jgi:hypothetical protein
MNALATYVPKLSPSYGSARRRSGATLTTLTTHRHVGIEPARGAGTPVRTAGWSSSMDTPSRRALDSMNLHRGPGIATQVQQLECHPPDSVQIAGGAL